MAHGPLSTLTRPKSLLRCKNILKRGGEVEREEVLERAESEGVKFVNLWFTDVVGMVKSVTIPLDQLPDCLDYGVWFDGSSVEGFARIAESDMYLMPDLDTFAIIPWEKEESKTARLICEVYTPQGEPFQGDPRRVLKRALEEAKGMGYLYKAGPEIEFFLFKPHDDGAIAPRPHDQAGYFDVPTDLDIDVRRQMVRALEPFGVRAEAIHHEVAPGQHEIDFQYSEALQAADNTITVKLTAKAIAQLNGLHATFLPKPLAGINGSGMHTHQSLFTENGENAFVDPHDEYGLSEVARYFIGGQLHHARGMCAILAPLVNSYKRLIPGYEAPVYISWARINRSALIRIPQVNPARRDQTRLELRCPDPSCNPYLAFAVMLKCGLDGIKKKISPPPPSEEDLYHLEDRGDLETLPGSLFEALEELKGDEVVQEALGSHIYEWFVRAKRLEWDAYRAQVTPWELRDLLIY